LSETELIYLDYFATGVSINGHPLKHMRARLRRAGVVDSQGLRELRGGEPIIIAVVGDNSSAASIGNRDDLFAARE
jgi:hypothetical protein